jgi:hypothetical protein
LKAQTFPFTDKQRGLIEKLYEKMMKGAGYEACSTKHDLNKQLRY